MSLTKEQWALIERALSSPFGRVSLRVPGHELTIEVRCIGKLRYAPCVFVDGWAKGEWLHPADHPIGKRFYQLHTRLLVPKAKAEANFKKLKRCFPAAEARRMSGIGVTYQWRSRHWSTPKTLCTHLRKNEPEISLVDPHAEALP